MPKRTAQASQAQTATMAAPDILSPPTSVRLALPDDLLDSGGGGGGGDDELPPLVDHDEFRQLVVDVAGGRDAVCVLSALLRGAATGLPDAQVCNGLGMLLESAEGRLRLALDTLACMAAELQIPSGAGARH